MAYLETLGPHRDHEGENMAGSALLPISSYADQCSDNNTTTAQDSEVVTSDDATDVAGADGKTNSSGTANGANSDAPPAS